MPSRSETTLAILERIGDDRLEVRVKPAAYVDPNGIAEVIAERRRMTADKPMGVLLVIPKDLDLDALAVSTDHYTDPGNAKGLRAVAVVVNSMLMETMTRLFLTYYPTPFPVSIFNNEPDANAWLSLEMAKPAGPEGA